MTEIKQYRKKPVVIEAIQINDSTCETIRIWSDNKVYASPICEPSDDNPRGVYWQVDTLEGTHIANPNDWIIKGIAGELYPCKPDIFDATYEVVE